MKNKSKISGKSGDSGGEENPAEADEGKDTGESHEGDLKDSLSFLLQSAASRYPRKQVFFNSIAQHEQRMSINNYTADERRSFDYLFLYFPERKRWAIWIRQQRTHSTDSNRIWIRIMLTCVQSECD